MRNFAAIVGLVLALPALAGAQSDPDIRNIRPVLVLLVDTSGSMERLPGGSTPPPPEPQCSGSAVGTNERNRWTTMLEALTGSWASFYCSTVDRSSASFIGQPDYFYPLAYHRPPIGGAQLNDGILDVYADRVKFGLMTFDATYTFTDSHPLLVLRSVFQGRLPDNASLPGGYSYGEPRALSFPGCGFTYMVDSGARNESAGTGAMISVGPENADYQTINQQIQNQLISVRPFGGTPTASMLDDFRYYLTHHPDVAAGSDPYAACRPRFGLLLTDGQPDEDFRDSRFNCDGVPGGCPYDLSHVIAGDLCRFSGGSTGTCTGIIDGLYVVAFDVNDSTAVGRLNAIASAGGTSAALLASNRTELLARIAQVIDQASPGTTTRSRPSFVTSGSTLSGGVAQQYELNAGFEIGDGTTPWQGKLYRQRYQCTAGLVPELQPLNSQDSFHDILNARSAARRLLTVVTPSASDMGSNLIGEDASAVPLGAGSPTGVVRNMRLSDFTTSNSALTAAHFGITTGSSSARTAERNAIIDWVHGAPGTVRASARLGDIYHSSPITVSAPRVDIADESFNLFRRRPGVADRPTVVYVGSNDGVLHAFAAEDNTGSSGSVRAGDEIWGFIPPILVPKLESATASHQIMLDGTPVVRDIFYRRTPGQTPSGDLYHTVLIMGFRGGAQGYFALDVTDPLNPRFLWQYVGEVPPGASSSSGGRSITPMGYSYGTPAMGQVLVDVNGTVQERAIAILPGGTGDIDTTRSRTTGPVGCPAQGRGTPPVTQGTTNARSHQRCWSNRGRVLTWVDVVTGEVVNGLFDESVFGAPLTGGVSLYPGDTGTIAQRAFFTDAEGIMWAADFSARRPADWTVRQFHDLFWDAGPLDAQPAYNPPVVSTDTDGNLIVLQGTGDIDRLDGIAPNRIASLKEVRTFDTSGTPRYTTSLNWEIHLQAGEQVTGPIELFESTAYFATFQSSSNPTDLCNFGLSRVWNVDYLNTSTALPAGYSGSRFPATGASWANFFMATAPGDPKLYLGVGITQRPTCIQGSDQFDPFVGRRFVPTQVGGGSFELVVQSSGGTRTSGTPIPRVTVQLATPTAFTSISGWAGRVDQ